MKEITTKNMEDWSEDTIEKVGGNARSGFEGANGGGSEQRARGISQANPSNNSTTINAFGGTIRQDKVSFVTA
ncbi:MAG: hypothetical protein K5978_03655 [Campylobacter sp.]|nr:hypothetical protein [Campylobacter sp.]